MRLDRPDLAEVLFRLALTRGSEETLASLHAELGIVAPLGLTRGLEAIGVGSALALEEKDSVASTLPTVGPLIAREVEPAALIGQLMGRAAATHGGWDGLRHFGDPARGVVAAAGHVATHVGVLAGISFAHRLRGEDQVALALVPSSGLSTGDFHEGLNFAVVRRCPLVVVVAREEDPGNAQPVDLREIATGYGLPTVRADGRDVLEVLQIVGTAVSRARSGHGPTLVEAVAGRCVRYRGYDGSIRAPFWFGAADDGRPLDGDEDPVLRFARSLESNDSMSSQEREANQDRARKRVSTALESARSSVLASPARGGHVYAV